MEKYKNHLVVPATTVEYQIIGQDKVIYLKDSKGEVSVIDVKEREREITAAKKEDATFLINEGYLGVFKLVFKNCTDKVQLNRLLTALDKYTGLYILLETHAWDLAKERIALMLTKKVILDEDVVLVNKYIDLASEVL